MSNTIAPNVTMHRSGGFAVARPRPTDAVGKSLREAFGQDCSLPRDMQMILHSID